MTQSTLADRLDVDPNVLGRWERGEETPSSLQLDALIEALEVDPAEAEPWIASIPPTDDAAGDWLYVSLDPVGIDLTSGAPRPLFAVPPPPPDLPATSAADPFAAADGKARPSPAFGLDRDALNGRRRDDGDGGSVVHFLRPDPPAEFDDLADSDEPPERERNGVDLSKPRAVQPANPNPTILNGSGPLPLSPDMDVNGSLARAPTPRRYGNGNGGRPRLSVVTPETSSAWIASMAAEQERRITAARQKAAGDRALREFVQRHGVTPAVYAQLRSSVNTGSAFPVPAAESDPGTVRYSETPIETTEKAGWVYTARRIATIVVLVVLAIVAFWAFSELASGWQTFMELWRSSGEDRAVTGALGAVAIPVGRAARGRLNREL